VFPYNVGVAHSGQGKSGNAQKDFKLMASFIQDVHVGMYVTDYNDVVHGDGFDAYAGTLVIKEKGTFNDVLVQFYKQMERRDVSWEVDGRFVRDGDTNPVTEITSPITVESKKTRKRRRRDGWRAQNRSRRQRGRCASKKRRRSVTPRRRYKRRQSRSKSRKV